MRLLGVPIKLSRGPGDPRRAPGPGLGEHTRDVLAGGRLPGPRRSMRSMSPGRSPGRPGERSRAGTVRERGGRHTVAKAGLVVYTDQAD